MNNHWESLLTLAWNQLWQVTVVVLLVATIVRLGCRHRPHLAYLLWMLVVVKCLTPPLWSCPTGVFSWAQVEVSAADDEARQTEFHGTVVLADTSPRINDDQSIETAFEPTRRIRRDNANEPDVAMPIDVVKARHRSINWPVVVFCVWLVGSATVLLTAIAKCIACWLIVRRSCRDADDQQLTSLQEIAARLGIKRRVRMLVCRRPLGPAVFGIMRPTILIPELLIAAKSQLEIKPILAHELIHFRRGDTIVGWFQFFAQALWWFHPLVWWASREASRERERCCDEEAIAGLDCEPGSYAQALIDVLNQKRLRPVFGSPAVRAVEITTRRLHHIMHDERSFHRHTPMWCWISMLIAAAMFLPGGGFVIGSQNDKSGKSFPLPAKSKAGEWNQFGGSSHRNNTPDGENAPTTWDVESGKNVRWKAKLGSSTYNSPVVADGKVFFGTNNGASYIERYPKDVDLSVLLCFEQSSGDFLWQYSIEKIFPAGDARARLFDWPMLGLCSVPIVDGKRLWVVTTRCEVVCLDIDGFRDGENDGPFKDEPHEAKDEADIIWKFDMIGKLDVHPHCLSNCSVTCAGDVLLVGTSNGVDEAHVNIPKPDAPSFIALNRKTGRLLWKDSSPGKNILHGQWSSPAYGVIDSVPQAIFAGGDGWLYSFDLRDIKQGKSNLLWWFDCNPKESKWELGGRGTRNNILCTPVIFDGLVYVAVGQDVEHGEGDGHLWCIDPANRGDISAELVYNERDPKTPIAHKRLQACEKDKGDFTRENPNSGVVWQYDKFDQNDDGKFEFEETMHRTVGTPTIKNDLLVIADASGLVHCLDAKKGGVHWTYDLFAATYGTPLIVDDKIYLGDEDGEMAIFKLSRKLKLISEIEMGSSIFGSAVYAGETLYIGRKEMLYAIAKPTRRAKGRSPRETRRGADQPRDEKSAAAIELRRVQETNTRVFHTKLADDMKLKWKLDTKKGIETTPAIANGVIYFVDVDGHLYAVDANKGQILWRFNLGSYIDCSPVVRDGRVYLGDADARFHCVNAATGDPEWSFQAEAEINGSANFWKDRVLFGAQDSNLYCLNAATGDLIWKRAVDAQIRTKLMVVDDIVAVAGCCKKLYIFDAKDGRQVASSNNISPTISSPAVRDGQLYVGSERGELVCIELESMRDLWRFKTKGANGAIRTSPSVTDGHVFFGSRDKNVYALDRETGAPLWTFKTNGRVDSSPIVVGERVLFGSADGRVRMLKLMTGEKVWEYETDGGIFGSVAIGDGIAIVCTDRGVIYCFGPANR